jgi:hypothetical protein
LSQAFGHHPLVERVHGPLVGAAPISAHQADAAFQQGDFFAQLRDAAFPEL